MTDGPHEFAWQLAKGENDFEFLKGLSRYVSIQ